MKVFISWSGARSLAIAKVLRDWLPRIIQAVQPWLSEADIGKGTRWEQEIGMELANSRFGIICLTPENLDSRWINFEAGAISKSVERTYVCTYLLDLKPTDIEGPLSQFNHTRADKEDTRKLLHTVNRALETQALSDNILNDAFNLYWPRLEENLNHLPSVKKREPLRSTNRMLEEILELVRVLSRTDQSSSMQHNAPKPRLITTLDWSTEDAQILTEFYRDQQENHQRMVNALATDEDFARTMLEALKNTETKKPIIRHSDPPHSNDDILAGRKKEKNEDANS